MMKRFGTYFEDVMAGRKGVDWTGFALMVLAISVGGAALVAPVLFVWFILAR